MPVSLSGQRVLSSALLIALVALIPVSIFIQAVDHAQGKAILLASAASTTIAGCALYPVRAGALARGARGSVIWSLLLALAFAGIAALYVPGALATPSLDGCLAVGILGFATDRATALLGSLRRDGCGAPLVVLLVLGLFGGTPVWLGPWAAVYVEYEQIANILIWASPLTYLSVMVDYDYLHSDWFYRYTPLGSLRYIYPGKLTFSAFYLALGWLLWLTERAIGHKPQPAY